MFWHFSKDLPDYSQLQDYEPPVMTRVHASDGSLVAEYATQRRLYLPIQAIPKLVLNAFIVGRRQELLRPRRARFPGHRPRDGVHGAELRHRPPSAGRLDHHAAGREELPAHQRGELRAQDQGSAARAEDRAHLLEGQDPRAVSQRDLSRARRLRRRGGLAALLRQVGARADARRSRLSRGAAEGAEQLSSVPPARARDRAAQLRARSHGRRSLPQARGRREGEEGPARRHDADDRRAHLRGGVFRRGSAPRPQRPLRREEALRGRPFGAHHARSEAAGQRAQGLHRRLGEVRREPRLSRRGPEARHLRRLGHQARRSEGALRRRAVAARGGARDKRSVRAHRPAARARTGRRRVEGSPHRQHSD